MRWLAEDMEKFEGAKEFIDTAIIPVFSFDMNEVGIKVVQEQKWLEEICVYTERQLTGRLMLFPTLYLLKGEPQLEGLHNKQFPHCFFVTTNHLIYDRLLELNLSAYLLERNEDEEELAVMVREGKKLTKKIMDSWKM